MRKNEIIYNTQNLILWLYRLGYFFMIVSFYFIYMAFDCFLKKNNEYVIYSLMFLVFILVSLVFLVTAYEKNRILKRIKSYYYQKYQKAENQCFI